MRVDPFLGVPGHLFLASDWIGAACGAAALAAAIVLAGTTMTRGMTGRPLGEHGRRLLLGSLAAPAAAALLWAALAIQGHQPDGDQVCMQRSLGWAGTAELQCAPSPSWLVFTATHAGTLALASVLVAATLIVAARWRAAVLVFFASSIAAVAASGAPLGFEHARFLTDSRLSSLPDAIGATILDLPAFALGIPLGIAILLLGRPGRARGADRLGRIAAKP